MRTVGAVVLVVALGGCGLRYTGTQEQMQQVARGAAEMMKKDPYSDTVAAAGTGAHMALSTLAGQPSEAAPACAATLSGGCLQPWQTYGGTADQGRKTSMKDFTGLPDDFHKETTIGKD
ncbi:hypothetical protein [Cupriavidus basilensis]|uniref:hypothetical protein n=1 Tax=Cupriavidus basilensis TaxID=68895 RepID=UPI0007519300|nr:hypothetical protein [Cupriavidus basilensis]